MERIEKDDWKTECLTTIYILKCQDNKWYIGSTSRDVKLRFEEHLSDKGSAFTSKYRPICIFKHFEGDIFDETKYTLMYMKKYGVENVRGGVYCKMNFTKQDIKEIQKHIWGAENVCFKCGKKGHFQDTCAVKEINFKVATFPDKIQSKLGSDISVPKEKSCYKFLINFFINICSRENKTLSKHCSRCGRNSHYQENCYAKKHLKGYQLI